MPDGRGATLLAQVDRLQVVRPLSVMHGYELCPDIHLALSVAQRLLRSRNRRVADTTDGDSSDALLRELRALGVDAAAPQLIAMVALIDAAVDRLADAGAMSEDEAWAEIRKDVLRKHCQDPSP